MGCHGRSADAASERDPCSGLIRYTGSGFTFRGRAGPFGYDLGRRFEKLPEHAQADISLPDGGGG